MEWEDLDPSIKWDIASQTGHKKYMTRRTCLTELFSKYEEVGDFSANENKVNWKKWNKVDFQLYSTLFLKYYLFPKVIRTTNPLNGYPEKENQMRKADLMQKIANAIKRVSCNANENRHEADQNEPRPNVEQTPTRCIECKHQGSMPNYQSVTVRERGR